MELLVGADPELFVFKKGTPISGHVFKCGTKHRPMKTENGHVQVDGLALEFNVVPAKTKGEFVKGIRSVLGDLQKIVQERDAECVLRAIPTVHFEKKYMQSLPPRARALGCNPDYNAYTLMENAPPNPGAPFRTGAGHVHLGWTHDADPDGYDHFAMCAALARELDYYLGLPSLEWDDDQERRSLYGKAGAFRPKSYGMEFRVLSNKWVSDETICGYVYDQTHKAFTRFTEGTCLANKYGELARKAINEGDKSWAEGNKELIDLL